MKQKKLLIAFGFYILSTIIIIIWLIPFLIAVFTSFKSTDAIAQNPIMWVPPTELIWNNFAKAWEEGHMGLYFRNTLIITIPSVIGALAVSSLSAFALAYYNFKLSRVILIVFVGGMLLPFQMLLIPVSRFSNLVGIINSFRGIILFHIAFQLGFCTFFLRNFMKTIPKSIYESARIDGANDFMIYRRIVLPLSLPALAALGIFLFTWIWNDYLWSLVLLQSDAIKPVTLGLANLQGQYITQYNIIAAASLIAMSIPVIVFLLFQRFFIEGLTVGSVKG
ncbi:MAG: carbohydrate ABC transporter permease [Spirochaetota bacterium]